MSRTLSTQGGNEERRAGCLGRISPLPTPERNCSPMESSFVPIEASTPEIGHTDSRDEPTNRVTTEDSVDAVGSKLRTSSSAKELESISKTFEERGVPKHEFLLLNPREAYDRNPAAQQLWESSKRWEPRAARPKPVYPHSSMEGETASRSGHKPGCSPSKTSLGGDQSTPSQVTPSLNSDVQSPNDGFQIQSNIFIPIRDSDESCSEVGSSPSSKQCSKSPIPRLKLRPRGNQVDLSIGRYGFS